MRQIDELFLKCPFYGSRKFAELLGVNRKRVQRLMRLMGIEAIYPKKRTTWPGAGHKITPYLLRNVAVIRPDQVWSTDITYVPMRHGFLYLVAVMDWYSRHVLSWRLSNTLSGAFCLEALEDALAGGRPEVFNSDQGSQFTASAFTDRLEACGVAISMDGCGRAIDNVFIERLWRSVKYEEVYLSEGVRDGVGGGSESGFVLPVLQPRANSPIARLSDSRGGLSQRPLKLRGRRGRKTSRSAAHFREARVCLS